MKVNANTQDRQYKKPSVGAVIGGVAAGSTVNSLIPLPYKRLLQPKISKNMNNLSKNISADEFKQVEKAISDTIQKSGLADKGISILKSTAANVDEVTKVMTKEFDKKYLPKVVKDLYSDMFASSISKGDNACYAAMSKKIVMPEKKLVLAMFHETGHAMNANLSKIGKILQKSRAVGLLSIPIALIALFKTKKGENEKPKNGFDKATTFIKNNAGKLTFATFIPTLLEEGMATINGNKFAKQLLSPELAKKVAKTNALGFSTYAITAIISGLGIFLGVKVKDAIAKPKPIQKTVQEKPANSIEKK